MLDKLKRWKNILIYGTPEEPEYVKEADEEPIEPVSQAIEAYKEAIREISKTGKKILAHGRDWDFVCGEFEIVGEGENAHAEYDEPDPVKEILNTKQRLKNIEKKARMVVHEISIAGEEKPEAKVETPAEREEKKKHKLEMATIIILGLIVTGVIYYIWKKW